MNTQVVERSSLVLSSLCALIKIALFVVAFVTLCPAVKSQSLDGRPVSRLITDGPTYTRARRVVVKAEEATTTSVDANMGDANDIERRAFESTNLARQQNGLPVFQWDSDLHRMARLHSESMALRGYFSHVSPEGLRLRDRARAAGIVRFNQLAENIASGYGYDDPGAFAVERWLISPGHRANILSAGFQSMAVGTFVAADGSVFLTQVFITR